MTLWQSRAFLNSRIRSSSSINSLWDWLGRGQARGSLHSQAQLKPETIERLEEQNGLLLRTYELELGKNPVSRATKSARSNLIALRHTINQIYGESAALLLFGAPAVAGRTFEFCNPKSEQFVTELEHEAKGQNATVLALSFVRVVRLVETYHTLYTLSG